MLCIYNACERCEKCVNEFGCEYIGERERGREGREGGRERERDCILCFSFCTKKCDVIKWAMLLHLLDPHHNLENSTTTNLY